MTRRSTPDFRAEDGVALALAIATMAVMLVIAGALFIEANYLSARSSRDTASERAFQVADAGIEVATHRLNWLVPLPAQCITTSVQAPGANGWCAETAPEAVGSRASYSYIVSKQLAANTPCAGTILPTSLIERCVVAIGRVGNVQRRVAARVAVLGPGTPAFSMGGLTATTKVKLESGADVDSDIGGNKEVAIGGGAVLHQPGRKITIGPRGKVKGCKVGCTYTRSATNAVVPQPDFADTATNNQNAILNTLGLGTIYDAATRTLTVPKGKTLALPAGVYNFCNYSFGDKSKIYAPSGGSARIYLDSVDRSITSPPVAPAPACPGTKNSFTAKGSATFLNPSFDPTKLQIFAWGRTGKKKKKAKVQKIEIPNAKGFAVVIIAPGSEIKFKSSGSVSGGIAADSIKIRKKMHFASDPRALAFLVDVAPGNYRMAWIECQPALDPASPNAGC